MGKHRFLRAAARWSAALTLTCLGAAAAADVYPSKPVRVIVPFPAGSSPDIVARYLSSKLAEQMGESFVVDNRAGAAGSIGARAVAGAPADGYTIFFMVNSIVTMNQFVYKELSYDPIKDFAPVSIVAGVPYVLIANKDFPHKTLADLIGAAKAQPGVIDYASMGVGGAGHVIMELMTSLSGVQLTHVPYKSGALVDVIGGRVPLIFQPTTTAIEQIRAGTVFALGTTGEQRLPGLPDTAAIAEVVPGFEADGWQGVMAPAGTPAPVIERLNREIAAVLALPETVERFHALGIQPWPTSAQEMAQIIEADIKKWGDVISRSVTERQ